MEQKAASLLCRRHQFDGTTLTGVAPQVSHSKILDLSHSLTAQAAHVLTHQEGWLAARGGASLLTPEALLRPLPAGERAP